MNPYRRANTGLAEDSPDNNGDVTFALAVLLVASLVRVVAAVVLHETFGAEATLALLFVMACLVHATRKAARRARQ